MAHFLGFNISRASPTIRAKGTDFEANTILNEVALAAVPARKASKKVVGGGLGPVRQNGIPAYNAPPIRDSSVDGEPNLNERYVTSDPRELYWGFLPNKIQPKQAAQMLRAALGGDLWQQWRLYSAMQDTWPKFAMASHQLREAVAYAKYVVHAYSQDGQEPTDSAIEKRDLIARALKAMSPNPFNDEKRSSGMIYNFTDAVLVGISMEELLWDDVKPIPGGGGKYQRLPRASAWMHPRHYTFGEQGQIVTYGSDLELMYNDRRLHGTKVGENPNPDKFICSQFMSRSGSAVASGFMRQLTWWWAARQYGLDFVLRLAQNFGGNFVDVTYKPSMTGTEKAAMLSEIIKGLGNRVLMHVEGSTLDVVPPVALGTENPQRWLIEESDRECLYLLLGQTGSTISEAGKLGNDDTKNAVKQERVAGVANWVAESSLDQFSRAILRQNYGNDDECPAIKPDFNKPLKSEEVGKLFQAVSSSKVPVRCDELYGEKTGFTKPQPGDEVFQDGQIKILGEPLTEEESFEQQLDQQSQMQELSQPEETPAPKNPKAKKKEKAKAVAVMPMNFRRMLAEASEPEIQELEQMVKAVENASHQNGELTALNQKILGMNKRR